MTEIEKLEARIKQIERKERELTVHVCNSDWLFLTLVLITIWIM
jgi:hypothetical protein